MQDSIAYLIIIVVSRQLVSHDWWWFLGCLLRLIKRVKYGRREGDCSVVFSAHHSLHILLLLRKPCICIMVKHDTFLTAQKSMLVE